MIVLEVNDADIDLEYYNRLLYSVCFASNKVVR